MTVIKICNKLRYHRERYGFSQAALASTSQVSKVTISKIERNQDYIPHHKTRRKLAEALNINVEQLFPAILAYSLPEPLVYNAP
jgi:transcriptional regulator with XRE-family HTH domain